MSFWYFKKSKRRNRDTVGPLLNLERVGVGRSEIVCDLFASVTTSKVCQASVL